MQITKWSCKTRYSMGLQRQFKADHRLKSQDDTKSQDIAHNLFLNGHVIQLGTKNGDPLIIVESQTIPHSV